MRLLQIWKGQISEWYRKQCNVLVVLTQRRVPQGINLEPRNKTNVIKIICRARHSLTSMTVGARYGTKLCETGTLGNMRIAAIQLSGPPMQDLGCRDGNRSWKEGTWRRRRRQSGDGGSSHPSLPPHSCEASSCPRQKSLSQPDSRKLHLQLP